MLNNARENLSWKKPVILYRHGCVYGLTIQKGEIIAAMAVAAVFARLSDVS